MRVLSLIPPNSKNMNFSKTFTKIEYKKNTWSQYDDTNPSQEKTLSIDSQNIYKGFTTQCDLATTKRNDRPSYNKAQDKKIYKSQNFSGYINSFSDKEENLKNSWANSSDTEFLDMNTKLSVIDDLYETTSSHKNVDDIQKVQFAESNSVLVPDILSESKSKIKILGSKIKKSKSEYHNYNKTPHSTQSRLLKRDFNMNKLRKHFRKNAAKYSSKNIGLYLFKCIK